MTHHHGMDQPAGMTAHQRHGEAPGREDRFGRMFTDLGPAYTRADVLRDIGALGGPMDDHGGPIRTASVPVGHVFFGQFIDHDITLDVSSSFDRVNAPGSIANLRTPALDLDCIYGAGPESHAYLYAGGTGPFTGAKLLTGADQAQGLRPDRRTLRRNDLLRAPNGRAIIGDHRNDENRVVSQLQLGMIKFHNLMCDEINARDGLRGGALYEAAREATTHHYQWAVLTDYLPAMCGAAPVGDILANGRKHYCPKVPFIPVEFAVAAYRFGHSMVPMEIQVQAGANAHVLFGPTNGVGFEPLAHLAAIVDWRELFSVPGGGVVQMAEKLDTKMASDLLDLKFLRGGVEPKAHLRSLATRNLLRGNAFELPGGDDVAAHIERPAAEIASVMTLVGTLSGGRITQKAPLWLYVLAEAEVVGREDAAGSFTPGEGLGPVGARIVAEVLIGLMELDGRSILGGNRNFVPEEAYDTIGKMLVAVNSDIF